MIWIIMDNIQTPGNMIHTVFEEANPAEAHSGRTEKDGCHYCRTNCEKYGVRKDMRHCHNTKPPINANISTSTNTSTATPKPDVPWEEIALLLTGVGVVYGINKIIQARKAIRK